jgi:hypothetical protein
MNAVVVNVTITDFELARTGLVEQVVPRVKQAPGLVNGYWLRVAEDRGMAVIVFEDEDAAQGAARMIESGGPPNDGVTIDSVDVREVTAHT